MECSREIDLAFVRPRKSIHDDQIQAKNKGRQGSGQLIRFEMQAETYAQLEFWGKFNCRMK